MCRAKEGGKGGKGRGKGKEGARRGEGGVAGARETSSVFPKGGNISPWDAGWTFGIIEGGLNFHAACQ